MIRLFLRSAVIAAGVITGVAGTAVLVVGAMAVGSAIATDYIGRSQPAPISPLTGRPLDGEARRG